MHPKKEHYPIPCYWQIILRTNLFRSKCCYFISFRISLNVAHQKRVFTNRHFISGPLFFWLAFGSLPIARRFLRRLCVRQPIELEKSNYYVFIRIEYKKNIITNIKFSFKQVHYISVSLKNDTRKMIWKIRYCIRQFRLIMIF